MISYSLKEINFEGIGHGKFGAKISLKFGLQL